MSEGDEATADMIRYVGQDSNIHLKSLKSDIISVTGVGIFTTLMFLARGRDLELDFSFLFRLCCQTLFNVCIGPAASVKGADVLIPLFLPLKNMH